MVPSGVQINRNNQQSINVSNYSNQGYYASFFNTGIISVTEVSYYGCVGDTKTLTVYGKPDLPMTAPSQVCFGATNIVYSVPALSGVNYNWQISGGAYLASGVNSNQIVLNYDVPVYSSSYATIQLDFSNVGCSNTYVTGTTINAIPPAPSILGPPDVCIGNTTRNYTLLRSSTGFTYNWTVPTGMVINSGNGTGTINVNVSGYTTTGQISVVARYNGCNSLPVNYTVKSPSTGTPSPIVAVTSTQICQSGVYSFNVPYNAGSIYSWSLPPGLVDNLRGLSINYIDVTNNGLFRGTGSISVTETTAGGCIQNPVSIAVSGAPNIMISGPTSFCGDAQNVTYSVQQAANTTYSWLPPMSGVSSSSGGQTNQFVVSYNGFVSGSLAVYATNTAGGCSGSASINLTAAPRPTTSVINGPGNICPGMTNATYSVTNTIGSTYNWVLPSGMNIIAGLNTNSVTVSIPSTIPTNFNGYVGVNETNSFGCLGSQVREYISSSADFTGSIIGPVKVCSNVREVQFVVPMTVGSTYNWTLPVGANIVVPTIIGAYTYQWARH